MCACIIPSHRHRHLIPPFILSHPTPPHSTLYRTHPTAHTTITTITCICKEAKRRETQDDMIEVGWGEGVGESGVLGWGGKLKMI